jgi:vesicle coat complex subunit
MATPSSTVDHVMLSLVPRILNMIPRRSPRLREVALKCVGLFGMLVPSLASQMIDLLKNAIQHDRATVQLTALRGLFDLFTVHGPQRLLAADSSAEGTCWTMYVAFLTLRYPQ